MFKALIPVIGIIVAVGLFFTYIQPTFKDIRAIQDETTEYAQAITKAAELQQRIDELKQKQSSISLSNLERLEALLPERIDEVAVLIDIDTLATLHNLTLGDIEVNDQKTDGGAKTDSQGKPIQSRGPLNDGSLNTQTGEPMSGSYATLDLSFSVSGTYDDFRKFLQDIERSLVLMEVTKITFVRPEEGATSFMINLQLFSLNPPTQ